MWIYETGNKKRMEKIIKTSLIIYILLSFPSALQLRVSFALPNNLPSFCPTSEADCLVSEQFSFYGVWLLASRPTPNLEDQGPSLSGSYPFTCPEWETLPVVMLLPA
jgi:hypothetical protein